MNVMAILLVCGIANPKPLKDFLLNTVHTYYQQDYSDHHIFSIDDLNEIKEKFNEIPAKDKLILTTEIPVTASTFATGS